LGDQAWYPGDLDRMFENIINDPFYQKYNVTVLSRPYYADDDDEESDIDYQIGPWVVLLENFTSSAEAKRLIELGQNVGYERSTDVGTIFEDGSFERKVSRGRTSTNAWCNDDECLEDETANNIYERIENLTQIPMDNYEPFQLLKYEEGQFYEVHHDFIAHEVHRRQGPRILTLFLYLNDVEEGGETDFPDLQLSVKPKLGRAVMWPSVLDKNPTAQDHRTEHQAKPVKRGVKYGANVVRCRFPLSTTNIIIRTLLTSITRILSLIVVSPASSY
jgi:prolyl 4-hydroxylase